MDKRSRKRQGSMSGDEIKKYVRFLAVPLVVAVLVLVIVIAGAGRTPKPDKGADEAGQSMAAGAAVADAGAEPGAAADAAGEPGAAVADTGTEFDLSGYQLRQDEIPELTALVEAYCQAKLDADPEALEQVFGRSGISEEELEQERSKMELVRQVVEGYENISCYAVDGPRPDTYVIYPYFEIRYKGAEAVVPSLTWACAKKDEEGQFYMTRDVSGSEAEHIAGVSRLEEVKKLTAAVKARAEEAVNGDGVLRQIYQIAPGICADDTGTAPAEPQTETPAETQTEAPAEASLEPQTEP